MESAAQNTIATFSGTLVQRQHMAAQHMVQLVLREDGAAGQNWLCVSDDVNHASLQIGGHYVIEGTLRQWGDRHYIYQPNITSAPLKKWRLALPASRFARLGLAAAAVLLVSGVGFGAVQYKHAQVPAADQSTSRIIVDTTQPAANTRRADSAAETTTTAPETTPVSATSTTTTKSTTSASTTPSTQGTTPASTAYCDAPVDIPITYTTAPDGTEPIPGSVGSKQTCYSDATGANPVTTVLTPMVPGTVASTPEG